MHLPIKAVLVFNVTARVRSISRAAEELGVTPSAVSQQIQLLESQFGVTLLTKAGRGIALTEAGERYFSMISEQMEQIEEATATIRGLRSVMTLTIRATPTLSNKWLLPRLTRLLDRHPDLEVRLDGTNEPTDFNQELVDLEIRHGKGRWPGLFVESLAEESFFPVCAPSYAKAGSLTAKQLTTQRLIHSVKSQAQWINWFQLSDVGTDTRWRRVLFDRSHMAIDAAARGMGIALESNLMMRDELRDGRLVCPLVNPPELLITTQWIVCPRDHLRQKKVSLFLEWLREERDLWQSEQDFSFV